MEAYSGAQLYVNHNPVSAFMFRFVECCIGAFEGLMYELTSHNLRSPYRYCNCNSLIFKFKWNIFTFSRTLFKS